jgi:hypothetical protein
MRDYQESDNFSPHCDWVGSRQETQPDLAEAMDTSRAVIHRLLDPKVSKALGIRLLRIAEIETGLTEPPRAGSTAHRRKSAALPATTALSGGCCGTAV